MKLIVESITDNGEVFVSFIRGVVSVEDFNKALMAHDWQGELAEELETEYWVLKTNGTWIKSKPTNQSAIVVTACYW